jgi:pentatricopeptide repeat protein
MGKLISEGNFEKALQEFQMFEDNTPERFSDVVVRNQALQCCAHLKDYKQSKEIFHKMKRNFSPLGQPNVFSYNIMLRIYFHMERYEKMQEIFDLMVTKKITPDNTTITQFLDMLRVTKNPDKAVKLIGIMKEIYLVPDLITLNAFLKLYCTFNMVDEAYQVLKEFQTDFNLSPDLATYTILMDMYGKARQVKKAEQLLTELVENGLEPDLRMYTILINMYGLCNGEAKYEKNSLSLCSDERERNPIRPDRFFCSN